MVKSVIPRFSATDPYQIKPAPRLASQAAQPADRPARRGHPTAGAILRSPGRNGGRMADRSDPQNARPAVTTYAFALEPSDRGMAQMA